MPFDSEHGPFEDQYNESNLVNIHIRCAARLDSLKSEYANGKWSYKHGADGGRPELFPMENNEAVITVWIWRTDSQVHAIQFQTNTGRLSPKYGDAIGIGAPFVYRGYDENLKRERALMGFKGHAGNEIDFVEPVWSNTRILDTRHVTVGDYKGGFVGNGHFDQLSKVSDPFKTVLKAIIVRAGAEVDAIECIFHSADDGEQRSGRAGGPGGTEYIFTLGENECIVSIAGRASARIDSLQFFTNTGRKSDVYGGPGGEPFVLKPPFKGPDGSSDANMSLLCFQGRAAPTLNYGNAITIHGLAPVWAPNPPVSFSLSIDHFAEEDLLRTAQGTPEIAHQSSTEVKNTTQDKATGKIDFSMQTTKSTSVTLSETSRSKIGGKCTYSVKYKGQAGVPLIAKGESEVSGSVEVAGEHEWGSTMTDGEIISRAFTETYEDSVTVRPGMKMVATTTLYKVVAKDVRWTGKMTVTYARGGTQIIDVDGTFDSVSCTKEHININIVPL